MCARLPMDRPESFFTTAGGGLGFSLPAAVGMALARPSTRVIAVLGDGAAMYSIQSLWSAAQLQLPMTIVVVNNGGYGTVRRFAARFGIGKAVGSDLADLDFVGLARAQGCTGVRVTRPELLADVLHEALRSAGPSLVEVVVSPS